MVKAWTIEIPGFVTMSANDYIRLHWGAQRKKKGEWEMLLRHYGCPVGVTKATGKRKVTVWRVSPDRLPDYANLWTPIDKLLIDAMKAKIQKRIGKKSVWMDGLAWIIDDSIEWLDCEVKQTKGSKRMVIRIEEVEK